MIGEKDSNSLKDQVWGGIYLNEEKQEINSLD